MTYLNAFLCGGLLCAVGQILIDRTQLTPVDHVIILHAPAHLSQKLLHVTSLPGSENEIAI